MTVSWPVACYLGGILLDVDEPGTIHAVNEMTGWDDASDARSGLAPRMQQDGAWDAAGTGAERVVDISGRIEEATPAAAYAVQRQLAALRPQSIYEFVVDHVALGPLSAEVRVTSSVKVSWIDDRVFTYDLQVTAPDPVKYGPATYGHVSLASATPGIGLAYPLGYPLDYGVLPGVTPGAIALANAGTVPYWPRLRIDGPVLNPVVTLVESGAWVAFNAFLSSGQWLDFDLANRRVLLNGQVSVRALVSFYGDWLSVPPGGGSIAWTADSAYTSAKLSVWGFEGAYQ